jgi:hypothetical protein
MASPFDRGIDTSMAASHVKMPSEEQETIQGRTSPLPRESEISQDESFEDDDEDFVKVEDEAVVAQVEQALAKLESKSFPASNEETAVSEPLPDKEKSGETSNTESAQVDEAVQETPSLGGKGDEATDGSVQDEIMSPRSVESEATSKPSEVVESESTSKQSEEKDAEEKESAKVGKATETVKEEIQPMEIGEWAAFSQEIFSLGHFPSEWVDPNLVNQSCNKDEKVWKRYFDSRCLLSKACEDPTDEHKEELTASHIYRKQIEVAFKEEWKSTTLGELLLKQTYQRATKVMRDANGVLEGATVVSTIFSPFFLPRAVQVCMRYHRLPNDFWCTWHIQFVSLKDVKEDNMAYWRPHLTDMWELCSNGYARVPTNEIGFFAVEDVDTAYLTPNMVRKIRKWLFGSINSLKTCDDFTLLKYIFGSSGAVHDFNVLDADIGYTWKANENQTNDMATYGNLSKADLEKATTIGTNWLEFQCRMITSSLRPVDYWYDPYDAKYYKGVWGEKLMEHRCRKYGLVPHDANIRENPHKVWDLAPHGIREVSIRPQHDDLINVGGHF